MAELASNNLDENSDSDGDKEATMCSFLQVTFSILPLLMPLIGMTSVCGDCTPIFSPRALSREFAWSSRSKLLVNGVFRLH